MRVTDRRALRLLLAIVLPVVGATVAIRPACAQDTTTRSSATETIPRAAARLPVRVPNVYGQPEKEAIVQLQRAHLQPVRRTAEPSRFPPGTISRTDPPANAQVAPGARVVYWISAGNTDGNTGGSTESLRVPQVVGHPAPLAALELLRANLRARSMGAEESSLDAGLVSRTDPRAGTIVKPGTVVSLWVSAPKVQFVVPDVIGQTRMNAVDELRSHRLDPTFGGSEASNLEEGLVSRTDPPAGTMVESNAAVIYWVAAPKPTTLMPDVIGQSRRDAESVLKEHRLRVIFGGDEPSELAEGLVARTDPPAGTRVELNSDVIYWVAAAKPPVVVPDVVGQSRGSAESELKSNQLQARFGGKESSDREEGLVTRTRPAAGEAVDAGSTVQFWVAAAKPPVVVPDVTKQTRGFAIAKLQSSGLQATFGGEEDSELDQGLVTRTEPVGGARVAPKTVVTFWIAAPNAPLPVTVPNVTGRPESDATAELRNVPLQPERAGAEASPIAAEQVTRTQPVAKTQVPSGSTVQYWVSSGPAVMEKVVPDVTRHGRDDAVAMLAGEQFVPRFGGTEASSVPEGEVSRTDPLPGSQAPEHAMVTFWISSGEPLPAWLPVGLGVLGGAILVGGGAWMFRKRFQPIPSPRVSPGSVPTFRLAPESETEFADEVRRKGPDQALTVAIEPGATEFTSPVPIDKIEVRHE